MENVICRGEYRPLELAAQTYVEKECRPACSMHDTCSVLHEEGKKAPLGSQSRG
jgi:hypothetical protein